MEINMFILNRCTRSIKERELYGNDNDIYMYLFLIFQYFKDVIIN